MIWKEYDAADFEEDQGPTLLYRNRIQRKGVGIIEIDNIGDEVVWWCAKCAAYGFHVAMGPKILMPGEKRQEDYEMWKQCPDCYDIQPTHVQEFDATILDTVETVETPFENTTEIIGANPKRPSAAGKRISAKKRGKKIRLDDDPEIDSLLKKYGDQVKVIK